MTQRIIVERVKVQGTTNKKIWRAYAERPKDHLGGMGNEPAEAVGFLFLNHPQLQGPFVFEFRSKPPENYHYEGKLPIIIESFLTRHLPYVGPVSDDEPTL